MVRIFTLYSILNDKYTSLTFDNEIGVTSQLMSSISSMASISQTLVALLPSQKDYHGRPENYSDEYLWSGSATGLVGQITQNYHRTP